jgi:hypothetical protein
MDKLKESKKAVWAFLTAALAWGYAVVASASGSITGEEWLGLAGVALTTLGVYFLKNEQPVDG